MSGIKYDAGKPKIHLIPKEALEMMASALEYGAVKYDKRNYEKGIEYTRLVDATLRHIIKWMHKQDLDDESGLNHVSHALANLSMLAYMIHNKKEFDDR